MLERALTLERALLAAATEAGRSVLIVGLSKLILGKLKHFEYKCNIIKNTGE